MRQTKLIWSLPILILFLTSLFFLCISDKKTENSGTFEKRDNSTATKKVPTTPKKGAKGTAKKSDVPTTSGITPTYRMEVGETKMIPLTTSPTIISVPKGHTVKKVDGIRVGYQGTSSDGRAMVTVQLRSGSKSVPITII